MFPFNLILTRPVRGSGLYRVVCLLLRESQQHLGVSSVMWHSVFLKIRMESSPLVQSTLICLCICSLHRGTVTAAKFPARVSSYRLVQAPVVLGTAWGCFCLLMTFILSFPFGSMTASHCLMGNVLTGPSFHAVPDSKRCTAQYPCLLAMEPLLVLPAVRLAGAWLGTETKGFLSAIILSCRRRPRADDS